MTIGVSNEGVKALEKLNSFVHFGAGRVKMTKSPPKKTAVTSEKSSKGMDTEKSESVPNSKDKVPTESERSEDKAVAEPSQGSKNADSLMDLEQPVMVTSNPSDEKQTPLPYGKTIILKPSSLGKDNSLPKPHDQIQDIIES